MSKDSPTLPSLSSTTGNPRAAFKANPSTGPSLLGSALTSYPPKAPPTLGPLAPLTKPFTFSSVPSITEADPPALQRIKEKVQSRVENADDRDGWVSYSQMKEEELSLTKHQPHTDNSITSPRRASLGCVDYDENAEKHLVSRLPAFPAHVLTQLTQVYKEYDTSNSNSPVDLGVYSNSARHNPVDQAEIETLHSVFTDALDLQRLYDVDPDLFADDHHSMENSSRMEDAMKSVVLKTREKERGLDGSGQVRMRLTLMKQRHDDVKAGLLLALKQRKREIDRLVSKKVDNLCVETRVAIAKADRELESHLLDLGGIDIVFEQDDDSIGHNASPTAADGGNASNTANNPEFSSSSEIKANIPAFAPQLSMQGNTLDPSEAHFRRPYSKPKMNILGIVKRDVAKLENEFKQVQTRISDIDDQFQKNEERKKILSLENAHISQQLVEYDAAMMKINRKKNPNADSGQESSSVTQTQGRLPSPPKRNTAKSSKQSRPSTVRGKQSLLSQDRSVFVNRQLTIAQEIAAINAQNTLMTSEKAQLAQEAAKLTQSLRVQRALAAELKEKEDKAAETFAMEHHNRVRQLWCDGDVDPDEVKNSEGLTFTTDLMTVSKRADEVSALLTKRNDLIEELQQNLRYLEARRLQYHNLLYSQVVKTMIEAGVVGIVTGTSKMPQKLTFLTSLDSSSSASIKSSSSDDNIDANDHYDSSSSLNSNQASADVADQSFAEWINLTISASTASGLGSIVLPVRQAEREAFRVRAEQRVAETMDRLKRHEQVLANAMAWRHRENPTGEGNSQDLNSGGSQYQITPMNDPIADSLRSVTIDGMTYPPTLADNALSIWADLSREVAETSLTHAQNEHSITGLVLHLRSEQLQTIAWTRATWARAMDRGKWSKYEGTVAKLLDYYQSGCQILDKQSLAAVRVENNDDEKSEIPELPPSGQYFSNSRAFGKAMVIGNVLPNPPPPVQTPTDAPTDAKKSKKSAGNAKKSAGSASVESGSSKDKENTDADQESHTIASTITHHTHTAAVTAPMVPIDSTRRALLNELMGVLSLLNTTVNAAVVRLLNAAPDLTSAVDALKRAVEEGSVAADKIDEDAVKFDDQHSPSSSSSSYIATPGLDADTIHTTTSAVNFAIQHLLQPFSVGINNQSAILPSANANASNNTALSSNNQAGANNGANANNTAPQPSPMDALMNNLTITLSTRPSTDACSYLLSRGQSLCSTIDAMLTAVREKEKEKEKEQIPNTQPNSHSQAANASTNDASSTNTPALPSFSAILSALTGSAPNTTLTSMVQNLVGPTTGAHSHASASASHANQVPSSPTASASGSLSRKATRASSNSAASSTDTPTSPIPSSSSAVASPSVLQLDGDLSTMVSSSSFYSRASFSAPPSHRYGIPFLSSDAPIDSSSALHAAITETDDHALITAALALMFQFNLRKDLDNSDFIFSPDEERTPEHPLLSPHQALYDTALPLAIDPAWQKHTSLTHKDIAHVASFLVSLIAVSKGVVLHILGKIVLYTSYTSMHKRVKLYYHRNILCNIVFGGDKLLKGDQVNYGDPANHCDAYKGSSLQAIPPNSVVLAGKSANADDNVGAVAVAKPLVSLSMSARDIDLQMTTRLLSPLVTHSQQGWLVVMRSCGQFARDIDQLRLQVENICGYVDVCARNWDAVVQNAMSLASRYTNKLRDVYVRHNNHTKVLVDIYKQLLTIVSQSPTLTTLNLEQNSLVHVIHPENGMLVGNFQLLSQVSENLSQKFREGARNLLHRGVSTAFSLAFLWSEDYMYFLKRQIIGDNYHIGLLLLEYMLSAVANDLEAHNTLNTILSDWQAQNTPAPEADDTTTNAANSVGNNAGNNNKKSDSRAQTPQTGANTSTASPSANQKKTKAHKNAAPAPPPPPPPAAAPTSQLLLSVMQTLNSLCREVDDGAEVNKLQNTSGAGSATVRETVTAYKYISLDLLYDQCLQKLNRLQTEANENELTVPSLSRKSTAKKGVPGKPPVKPQVSRNSSSRNGTSATTTATNASTAAKGKNAGRDARKQKTDIEPEVQVDPSEVVFHAGSVTLTRGQSTQEQCDILTKTLTTILNIANTIDRVCVFLMSNRHLVKMHAHINDQDWAEARLVQLCANVSEGETFHFGMNSNVPPLAASDASSQESTDAQVERLRCLCHLEVLTPEQAVTLVNAVNPDRNGQSQNGPLAGMTASSSPNNIIDALISSETSPNNEFPPSLLSSDRKNPSDKTRNSQQQQKSTQISLPADYHAQILPFASLLRFLMQYSSSNTQNSVSPHSLALLPHVLTRFNSGSPSAAANASQESSMTASTPDPEIRAKSPNSRTPSSRGNANTSAAAGGGGKPSGMIRHGSIGMIDPKTAVPSSSQGARAKMGTREGARGNNHANAVANAGTGVDCLNGRAIDVYCSSLNPNNLVSLCTMLFNNDVYADYEYNRKRMLVALDAKNNQNNTFICEGELIKLQAQRSKKNAIEGVLKGELDEADDFDDDVEEDEEDDEEDPLESSVNLSATSATAAATPAVPEFEPTPEINIPVLFLTSYSDPMLTWTDSDGLPITYRVSLDMGSLRQSLSALLATFTCSTQQFLNFAVDIAHSITTSRIAAVSQLATVVESMVRKQYDFAMMRVVQPRMKTLTSHAAVFSRGHSKIVEKHTGVKDAIMQTLQDVSEIVLKWEQDQRQLLENAIQNPSPNAADVTHLGTISRNRTIDMQNHVNSLLKKCREDNNNAKDTAFMSATQLAAMCATFKPTYSYHTNTNPIDIINPTNNSSMLTTSPSSTSISDEIPHIAIPAETLQFLSAQPHITVDVLAAADPALPSLVSIVLGESEEEATCNTNVTAGNTSDSKNPESSNSHSLVIKDKYADTRLDDILPSLQLSLTAEAPTLPAPVNTKTHVINIEALLRDVAAATAVDKSTTSVQAQADKYESLAVTCANTVKTTSSLLLHPKEQEIFFNTLKDTLIDISDTHTNISSILDMATQLLESKISYLLNSASEDIVRLRHDVKFSDGGHSIFGAPRRAFTADVEHIMENNLKQETEIDAMLELLNETSTLDEIRRKRASKKSTPVDDEDVIELTTADGIRNSRATHSRNVLSSHLPPRTRMKPTLMESLGRTMDMKSPVSSSPSPNAMTSPSATSSLSALSRLPAFSSLSPLHAAVVEVTTNAPLSSSLLSLSLAASSRNNRLSEALLNAQNPEIDMNSFLVRLQSVKDKEPIFELKPIEDNTRSEPALTPSPSALSLISSSSSTSCSDLPCAAADALPSPTSSSSRRMALLTLLKNKINRRAAYLGLLPHLIALTRKPARDGANNDSSEASVASSSALNASGLLPVLTKDAAADFASSSLSPSMPWTSIAPTTTSHPYLSRVLTTVRSITASIARTHTLYLMESLTNTSTNAPVPVDAAANKKGTAKPAARPNVLQNQLSAAQFFAADISAAAIFLLLQVSAIQAALSTGLSSLYQWALNGSMLYNANSIPAMTLMAAPATTSKSSSSGSAPANSNATTLNPSNIQSYFGINPTSISAISNNLTSISTSSTATSNSSGTSSGNPSSAKSSRNTVAATPKSSSNVIDFEQLYCSHVIPSQTQSTPTAAATPMLIPAPSIAAQITTINAAVNALLDLATQLWSIIITEGRDTFLDETTLVHTPINIDGTPLSSPTAASGNATSANTTTTAATNTSAAKDATPLSSIAGIERTKFLSALMASMVVLRAIADFQSIELPIPLMNVKLPSTPAMSSSASSSNLDISAGGSEAASDYITTNVISRCTCGEAQDLQQSFSLNGVLSSPADLPTARGSVISDVDKNNNDSAQMTCSSPFCALTHLHAQWSQVVAGSATAIDANISASSIAAANAAEVMSPSSKSRSSSTSAASTPTAASAAAAAAANVLALPAGMAAQVLTDGDHLFLKPPAISCVSSPSLHSIAAPATDPVVISAAQLPSSGLISLPELFILSQTPLASIAEKNVPLACHALGIPLENDKVKAKDEKRSRAEKRDEKERSVKDKKDKNDKETEPIEAFSSSDITTSWNALFKSTPISPAAASLPQPLLTALMTSHNIQVNNPSNVTSSPALATAESTANINTSSLDTSHLPAITAHVITVAGNAIVNAASTPTVTVSAGGSNNTSSTAIVASTPTIMTPELLLSIAPHFFMELSAKCYALLQSKTASSAAVVPAGANSAENGDGNNNNATAKTLGVRYYPNFEDAITQKLYTWCRRTILTYKKHAPAIASPPTPLIAAPNTSTNAPTNAGGNAHSIGASHSVSPHSNKDVVSFSNNHGNLMQPSLNRLPALLLSRSSTLLTRSHQVLQASRAQLIKQIQQYHSALYNSTAVVFSDVYSSVLSASEQLHAVLKSYLQQILVFSRVIAKRLRSKLRPTAASTLTLDSNELPWQWLETSAQQETLRALIVAKAVAEVRMIALAAEHMFAEVFMTRTGHAVETIIALHDGVVSMHDLSDDALTSLGQLRPEDEEEKKNDQVLKIIEKILQTCDVETQRCHRPQVTETDASKTLNLTLSTTAKTTTSSLTSYRSGYTPTPTLSAIQAKYSQMRKTQGDAAVLKALSSTRDARMANNTLGNNNSGNNSTIKSAPPKLESSRRASEATALPCIQSDKSTSRQPSMTLTVDDVDMRTATPTSTNTNANAAKEPTVRKPLPALLPPLVSSLSAPATFSFSSDASGRSAAAFQLALARTKEQTPMLPSLILSADATLHVSQSRTNSIAVTNGTSSEETSGNTTAATGATPAKPSPAALSKQNSVARRGSSKTDVAAASSPTASAAVTIALTTTRDASPTFLSSLMPIPMSMAASVDPATTSRLLLLSLPQPPHCRLLLPADAYIMYQACVVNERIAKVLESNAAVSTFGLSCFGPQLDILSVHSDKSNDNLIGLPLVSLLQSLEDIVTAPTDGTDKNQASSITSTLVRRAQALVFGVLSSTTRRLDSVAGIVDYLLRKQRMMKANADDGKKQAKSRVQVTKTNPNVKTAPQSGTIDADAVSSSLVVSKNVEIPTNLLVNHNNLTSLSHPNDVDSTENVSNTANNNSAAVDSTQTRSMMYRSPFSHTVQQVQVTLCEHYRNNMRERVDTMMKIVEQVRQEEVMLQAEWITWVRALNKRK